MLAIKRYLLVLLSSFFLVSCSAALSDYANEQPVLKLEEFFNGKLVAYGMVQNYQGKVVQRFKADLVGTWNGNDGILDETFYYADGSEQKRLWRLKKTAENKYEGTADDVKGTAFGEVAGNALNWTYQLTVVVDGDPVTVTLDDWLYLIDANNMINRTQMKKYGFGVGEITLYITKL